MDLEQQLRAALVPARPAPQVRAAVMARLAAGPGRRGVNRWVLAGAVLALGAAAAMLAMQVRKPVVSIEVVGSSAFPAAPLIDGDETPVSLDPAPAGPPTAMQGEESQPVVPAINPFTVQVLPLQGDVVDPPRKAAIEAVYAAVVDGLRAVPGLTLVDPAKEGSEAPTSANYRLTLEGGAVQPSASVKGDFGIRMIAERLGSDGRAVGSSHFGATGELTPGCVSPASMDVVAGGTPCTDPRGVATSLLATLRKVVFPVDPQLQRRLQARLVDQELGAGERLRALTDLGRLGSASGNSRWDEFSPSLRDPALIRGVIQLVSTTPDPAARAQVWYTLRGSRDPALVDPLVAALRTDPDDDTRVQALATLSADFATDQRVKVALEAAASGDPAPLVRALAQRALGGESSWTEYVLASLKDAGRSPVERVEALFYAYGVPTARGYGSHSADGRILRALDDAGMRALTEMLPRAAADSERYAQASHTLVSELAYVNHPAITDMLLEGLNADRMWIDRSWAVEALRRRPTDPRVRAALDRIAAEDADPRVRELAAKPLGPEEKSVAATAGPPRLGIMMEYVQSARDVPAELVGKLTVSRMGAGSVAERAGMKEEDVLLEVDGKPITSGPQLIEVLDALPRDVPVDVLVSRSGQAVRLTARF